MNLNLELGVEGVVRGIQVATERLTANVPVALKLAGDMVAGQAKTTHEYIDRTTTLTNSIMADEVRGSFGSGLELIVGAGAPYAAPIEFGSKPHKIRPRDKKALAWPVEGGMAFAGEVNHPGNKAYRFLGNAVDNQLPAITEVFEDATALSFQQAGFEIE